ncbi:MAG: sulfite exporter TauE/SafE family protein [Thalassovita sp.]
MLELIGGLPPSLSINAALFLMGASFVSSFITVAFGIGGGALLLAIMASLVPPIALIPVHGVVQLGSNLVRASMLRRAIHWPVVPLFVLGALGGVVLGGVVAIDLSPEMVQIGIGAFILWTIFAKPPAWFARWPALIGVLSSFLTMFFGATGVFVAGFVKSLGLDRHAHVATHATFMSMQHGLKVLVFGLLGFAFGPWVMVIFGLIAAGALGTWLGKRVLNRASNPGFQRALNIVLCLIAMRLIVAALWPMFFAAS